MPGPLIGFNRRIGFNTGTAVAYGSYGTADTLFNVTSGPWAPTIERLPDTDEYTGYEEDTSGGTSRVIAESAGGPIGGRATPHVIAALACAALGTWSSGTAGTLGTAATAYRHRIRPRKGTTGTQGMGTLPALTVYETLSGATDLQYAYADCLVNSFSISGSRKNWITYSAELIGSGLARVDVEALPGTTVAESYLKAGDVAIFLGTALAATIAQSKTAPGDITGTAYGTAIAVTGKVLSFEWSVANNLQADDGYGMNSGTTRDHMDRGPRTQTLALTMELHNSGQIGLLRNQKTLALEFEAYNELIESNAFYGFNLGFPRLHVLTAVPAGGPREKMTIAFTFNVGEDTTKGSVLLDVYNTRSAYLQ